MDRETVALERSSSHLDLIETAMRKPYRDDARFWREGHCLDFHLPPADEPLSKALDREGETESRKGLP